MSITPTYGSSFIDPISSYYNFVYQNMKNVNPSRLFAGVSNSLSWPPKQVLNQTLYLLYLNSMPVNSQRSGSQYAMEYVFNLQWIWLVMGDNINQTQQGSNQGDRYQTNMQIMSDLRQANYPGFTTRQQFAADPTSGAITTISDIAQGDSSSSIRWDRLKFPSRLDKASGILYGTATVSMYAYSVELPSFE